jgi:tetratricopeptide (TPR) repeat protein
LTQDPESDFSQYREDFGVRATPTVLFIDSTGKEIDRFVGFGGEEDVEETFQMIKDFAAGVNTLPALQNELDANPEDVELNYKMAKKYQVRYEDDKTAPYFNKILELDPEDDKGYRTEATYEVAVFEAGTNQNIEPLKAFIASEPSEDYLIMAYNSLARTFQTKRENDKAIEVYEEALVKLPDNARLNYSYASAVFNSRMEQLYEKALERNEKAKTLDPDLELSTVRNIIRYYTNIENKDMVVETYEGAIQKWPDSNSLKSSYASAINSMEIESKYDYGIELMEKLIEANPDSITYYYSLSNLYHKKGELEKAVVAMKKVAEKYPTQKRYQDALQDLEKELAEKK